MASAVGEEVNKVVVSRSVRAVKEFHAAFLQMTQGCGCGLGDHELSRGFEKRYAPSDFLPTLSLNVHMCKLKVDGAST